MSLSMHYIYDSISIRVCVPASQVTSQVEYFTLLNPHLQAIPTSHPIFL